MSAWLMARRSPRLLMYRRSSLSQCCQHTRPLSPHCNAPVLEECPHSWLFPQLKGAIHHGGAGTTATSLRHGLPSTVVAFFADQPAWGRTLERLGVSPATHRLPSVSAETLAISMGAIADNPSFRQRARELQQMLAGEDGVANVVAEIEARLIRD